MTKEKKIILGSLAAIGGILLYARAKKKRDLLNSGVDDLKKSFLATVDGGGVIWTGEGEAPIINVPNLQKSDAEKLKEFGIEV